jgi:hypothetical protein
VNQRFVLALAIALLPNSALAREQVRGAFEIDPATLQRVHGALTDFFGSGALDTLAIHLPNQLKVLWAKYDKARRSKGQAGAGAEQAELLRGCRAFCSRGYNMVSNLETRMSIDPRTRYELLRPGMPDQVPGPTPSEQTEHSLRSMFPGGDDAGLEMILWREERLDALAGQPGGLRAQVAQQLQLFEELRLYFGVQRSVADYLALAGGMETTSSGIDDVLRVIREQFDGGILKGNALSVPGPAHHRATLLSSVRNLRGK